MWGGVGWGGVVWCCVGIVLFFTCNVLWQRTSPANTGRFFILMGGLSIARMAVSTSRTVWASCEGCVCVHKQNFQQSAASKVFIFSNFQSFPSPSPFLPVPLSFSVLHIIIQSLTPFIHSFTSSSFIHSHHHHHSFTHIIHTIYVPFTKNSF